MGDMTVNMWMMGESKLVRRLSLYREGGGWWVYQKFRLVQHLSLYRQGGG